MSNNHKYVLLAL